MSRMTKRMKREWAFFIHRNGRRKYNRLCRRCIHHCKQSFRATIMKCPRYCSKRSKRRHSHKLSSRYQHEEVQTIIPDYISAGTVRSRRRILRLRTHFVFVRDWGGAPTSMKIDGSAECRFVDFGRVFKHRHCLLRF